MIRAIIFTQKRTGSTFLQNAINSHSNIIGIDEVFVNIARRTNIRKSGFIPFVNHELETPREYIEDVLYRTYPDENIAFKLLNNQIIFHTGLMMYVISKKIPIIFLKRKNLIKQAVSFYKMAENNHNPIDIAPFQLFLDVKKIKEENEYWYKKLKNNIKLVLNYEDIIGRTEGDKTYLASNANIAICDFFNVKQEMMYSTTKKKNKEDISEYLPNYEIIKKTFKGTEFEWMID